MNACPWLDPVWAGWLAQMLGHALWIGAAAAAFCWIGASLARQPETRHAVCLLSHALLVAGLVMAACANAPARSAHEAAPLMAASAADIPIAEPHATAISSGVTSRATMPRTALWDWRGWMVDLWALGVVALAARTACGWVGIQRLRRRSSPVDAILQARFAGLAGLMRIPRPELLICARLSVPAVVGLWRPAVLLPASMASGFPPEQLEALLLHELAHLRQRDHLIEPLVSLLGFLLFFHPAVHWMASELRATRELSCDRRVVAAGVEATGFARALLALAEQATRVRLAASGGSLRARIELLLGRPERRGSALTAFASILCIPMLALALHACALAEPATHSAEHAPAAAADAQPSRTQGKSAAMRTAALPASDLTLRLYEVSDLIDPPLDADRRMRPDGAWSIQSPETSPEFAGSLASKRDVLVEFLRHGALEDRSTGFCLELRSGHVLFVSATEAIHSDIKRRLEALREAQSPCIRYDCLLLRLDSKLKHLLEFEYALPHDWSQVVGLKTASACFLAPDQAAAIKADLQCYYNSCGQDNCAGFTVTAMNGTVNVLTLDHRGWEQSIVVQLQGIASADRKYVTVTSRLAAGASADATATARELIPRIQVTTSSGQCVLSQGDDPAYAVLLTASVVRRGVPQ